MSEHDCMEHEQLSLALGGLAVLVVLAGCLSGGGGGQPASPTATPTAPPPDESPTPTTDDPPPTTDTPRPTQASAKCPNSVAFYGLGSPGETAWEPDRIAIGYTVPANASVFFVAFEEGTVVGTTHVTTRDLGHGVTADGDGIPLDEPLRGSKMIRVAAFADSNGNGEFDFGNDTPCRDDGEQVEAGPQRINFSAFQSTPQMSGSGHPCSEPRKIAQQVDVHLDRGVYLENAANETITACVTVQQEGRTPEEEGTTPPPLVDKGYRMQPGSAVEIFRFQEPGRYTITVETSETTATETVELTAPDLDESRTWTVEIRAPGSIRVTTSGNS